MENIDSALALYPQTVLVAGRSSTIIEVFLQSVVRDKKVVESPVTEPLSKL